MKSEESSRTTFTKAGRFAKSKVMEEIISRVPHQYQSIPDISEGLAQAKKQPLFIQGKTQRFYES